MCAPALDQADANFLVEMLALGVGSDHPLKRLDGQVEEPGLQGDFGHTFLEVKVVGLVTEYQPQYFFCLLWHFFL
ncbi:MAG: hypothetical protein EYX74_05090 [Desulfobulbaceae bacterium]|nr:MAG: hypothetical protein EYX74_05090 [Desulfobulbaceae bacterium]